MKCMNAVITMYAFISLAVLASEQEPPGSTTSFSINTNNSSMAFSNHTSGSNWVVHLPPRPIALPHTFKDADSGIVLYVESDGRHVSAINPDGKILWTKDPFADAHLEFYRTHHPQLVYLGAIGEAQKWMEKAMAGKGSGKFIALSFNSTQSGVLDLKTGDFTFMGQD